MTKKELAASYHANRCNCSQAVVCAFQDATGLDEATSKQISKQYGGGAHGYCGAIMGMFTVANIVNGHTNLENPGELTEETKAYLLPLSEKFNEKNKSVYCKELKGIHTGKVLRSCRGCVEDCAEILDEYLSSRSQ